ncbi:hypothetical protein NKR23_g3145 [Pleurostoma richardsiae]|uniref:Uncharacterized protein n=1 Tax=Pleurostoma richardsiae TaxID=41990 RepID=A0AA38S5W4_9PEZI|nr:hypothetical protein NKR23_g3145 [Pleurostoma richardsiae]
MPLHKQVDCLALSLAALRIWQWFCSFLASATFALLFNLVGPRHLAEDGRVKAVQILGVASLLYSSLAISLVQVLKWLGRSSWRTFGLLSIPGDILMTGVFLAEVVLLSAAGLPLNCYGLTKDKYFSDDLTRQGHVGYSTTSFGPGARHDNGDIDHFCHFPRTIWCLAITSIFSYTFTIPLTVLYLQQYQPAAVDDEKAIAPEGSQEVDSDAGEAVDHGATSSPQPSPPSTPSASRSSSPSRQGSVYSADDIYSACRPQSSHSDRRSQRSRSSTSSWGATTLASDSDSELVSGEGRTAVPVHLANTIFSRGFPRRSSTSTVSSANAELFLVSDGFRPQAEGPEYVGRPLSWIEDPEKKP